MKQERDLSDLTLPPGARSLTGQIETSDAAQAAAPAVTETTTPVGKMVSVVEADSTGQEWWAVEPERTSGGVCILIA